MKFRTWWYREQRREAMELISKRTAGRKRRPPASVPETWGRMENISIRLNRVLQELFEAMRQPGPPGGHAPEFSISLIADLPTDSLPPAFEDPARQKPVTLRGRRKIVPGGEVEAHAVLARIEIVAKAVVYGLPGEAPPAEMSRSTWFLPLESAEKQEKQAAW